MTSHLSALSADGVVFESPVTTCPGSAPLDWHVAPQVGLGVFPELLSPSADTGCWVDAGGVRGSEAGGGFGGRRRPLSRIRVESCGPEKVQCHFKLHPVD